MPSNRRIHASLVGDTGSVKTEETHRNLSDCITAKRYCDGRGRRQNSPSCPILLLIRTPCYNQGQNHGKETAYAGCKPSCILHSPRTPERNLAPRTSSGLKTEFYQRSTARNPHEWQAIARLLAIRNDKQSQNYVSSFRDTGRVKTEETHRKLNDHITAELYCHDRSEFACLSDSATDPNRTLQSRTKSR